MKVTKRQLRRIIRESIDANLRLDAVPEEDHEYDLGFSDGVNGLDSDVQSSDYSDAYTAGYNDGASQLAGEYKVSHGGRRMVKL